MSTIQELQTLLNDYHKTQKDLDEVKKLIHLSTAKGHSDGRWQPELYINYQVAYQESIGSNNYHKSEVLNEEVEKLIREDLHKYRLKAIDNIRNMAKQVEDALSPFLKNKKEK